MAVTVVPSQEPGQVQIYETLWPSPYSPLWWTTQAITQIPADSLGWLLAQGWAITGVAFDNTTVPPTPQYTMARESLNNWQILYSLLEEYTTASNEAKERNAIRYNDIVVNWTEMIETSQTHFDTQATLQNTHETTYLTNLDSYMSTVDTLIDSSEADLVADSALAATALGELNTKLDDLETNANANNVTVTDLLTDQSVYLETFLADFAAELAELDTNYAAHLSQIDVLLADVDTDLATFTATQASELSLLSSEYTSYASDLADWLLTIEADYDTHVSTATAFLTDLGTTELARINEAFDATLTTQTQQLLDRGFYSSAITTDITARNTRDENEEIASLNDRLNREKWENQHRLYGQQVAMRGRTLEVESLLYGAVQQLRGVVLEEAARLQNLSNAVTTWKAGTRDRLLEQIQGIVTQNLAGIDRQHAAQQDVSKVAMSERDVLLGQLQDAVKAILQGKDTYAGSTMQKASTLVEQRHRVVSEKMAEFAARLEGLQAKHAEAMRLMEYQLDERNKLLVGLYGFVERREDIGPNFDNLATLCTSLGDAGGGWITP